MVCTVRLKPLQLTSLSISATKMGTIMPAMIFITAMNTVLYSTLPIFGSLAI